MTHQRDEPSFTEESTRNLISGAFTGMVIAGVFNPWDRALYLSVKHRRPFLHRSNFKSPYHGFAQAVFQRTFSGGIYFIAQSEMQISLFPYLHETLKLSENISQVGVGLTTGLINGALTSPLTVIRYKCWGKEKASLMGTARYMWKHDGPKIFFKGTYDMLARDMLFGCTYESLRHLFKQQGPKIEEHQATLNFAWNALAACSATIVSAPFNYTRNIKYATPAGQKPPSMKDTLLEVWREAREQSTKQAFGRSRYIQQRFKLGWGTARVGVTMAVGQQVFDRVKQQLAK